MSLSSFHTMAPSVRERPAEAGGSTAIVRPMAHPIMFDDNDPLLAHVRGLALVLPGAAEKVSFGRPVFFTTKLFAYYGGSRRVDGAWEAHDHSLIVRVDDDERRALLEDRRVYLPAYLAPSGWVGVDLDVGTTPDWDEIAELLDASYRLTAPKKLVNQLDATSSRRQPD